MKETPFFKLSSWITPLLVMLVLLASCTLAACRSQEEGASSSGEAAGASADEGPLSADAIRAMTFTPLEEGVPGSPGNLIRSPSNPNGASEMAVLMREMQAASMMTRAAILEGTGPGALPAGHERLFSTWPTQPQESIRTPLFEDLSRGYLFSLKALHEGDAEEAATRFDAMLDGCLGCHQQFCPGPVAAIEALRIPQAGAAGETAPH